MIDTTFLQALLEAHDPAYDGRELLSKRLATANFLAPFSLDEVRWVNNQIDPRRSRQLPEPELSATNLFEYLQLLEVLIGRDTFYTDLIEKHFQCDKKMKDSLLRDTEKLLIYWGDLAEEQLKRKKSAWTEAETQALVNGLKDFGYNWKQIKESQPALRNRTSGMQIRDKCWQMRKQALSEGHDLSVYHDGLLHDPVPGKDNHGLKRRIEWTDEEMAALEQGLRRHGYNWKKILESQPALVNKSAGTELRDRCWQIRRDALKKGEDMESYRGGLYKETIPGKETGQILQVRRKSIPKKPRRKTPVALSPFLPSDGASRPSKSILKGSFL